MGRETAWGVPCSWAGGDGAPGMLLPLGSCCPWGPAAGGVGRGMMMGAQGLGSRCPWDHGGPGMMGAWAWDQGAVGITCAWWWDHSAAGVTEPKAWDYSVPGTEVPVGPRCPGHAMTVADMVAPSPRYPPAPAFEHRYPPCLPARVLVWGTLDWAWGCCVVTKHHYQPHLITP